MPPGLHTPEDRLDLYRGVLLLVEIRKSLVSAVESLYLGGCASVPLVVEYPSRKHGASATLDGHNCFLLLLKALLCHKSHHVPRNHCCRGVHLLSPKLVHHGHLPSFQEYLGLSYLVPLQLCKLQEFLTHLALLQILVIQSWAEQPKPLHEIIKVVP